MSRKDLGPRAIFGVPLVLGALALVGLVGALLEDGAWDLIGSILLAASVAVVVRARLRKRARRPAYSRSSARQPMSDR